MASYGTYTKTSYGADNDGGGGFVAGSQGGSQGGQRNYNEDSLRPVLVKQLLDAEEAYPGATEVTIDGAVATQLTLVGQVRSVVPQPTNVTYRIDDGTGIIDVKKWVDADKNSEAEAVFEPGQFVRVFGRLKYINQKRNVGAHFLRAVEDYNEVSYHLLEAAWVHLTLTRGAGAAGGAGAGGAGGKAGGGDGMFVDQYGGGGGGAGGGGMPSGLSPNAQRALKSIQAMQVGNEGVHINMIMQELKLGYPQAEAAVQELSEASLIYATVDDQTFMAM